MRKKLPILRIIRQTLDYLGDHGGPLIGASPLLILILLGGVVLGMHLNHMAYVEQSKLLELAGWVVSTAAPVLAAVAWHRCILLGETPAPRLVAGKPERMYFIVLLVSAALALAFAVALLGYIVMLFSEGSAGPHWLGMVLVLLLILSPCFFLGYFFLALPHAALTGRMDMSRIAGLVKGNRLRLFAVAMLPVPLLLLLEAVRIFLLQVPRAPGISFYLYTAISTFAFTLVSVTSMSVSYRTLALTSTEERADSPLVS
ncbi:hypothetical protein [Achromobacter aegrifaciens]|uniref:hypothetical protein n=1 Tax=Achromobacter aegrifaciens TaxID=1287736 RepID=UPI0028A7A6D5|nr:hypothetical protein [Achromobacter aegrifaciens]